MMNNNKKKMKKKKKKKNKKKEEEEDEEEVEKKEKDIAKVSSRQDRNQILSPEGYRFDPPCQRTSCHSECDVSTP